jgi:nitrous oxide reductase accessory protein NosL
MKTIYYILTFSLVLFFMNGCAKDSLQTKQNRVMFQSVPVDKAIIMQKGKDAQSCAICGMNLPKFYKTNHVATTKNGLKQYCSLHCLVHDNEINKTDLSNVKVVDTNTLQFIDAMNAYYVVGSSKPATMSKTSKYAFATKEAAEKFAKANGGKVMKFYDAYDIAIKDFTKR